MEKFHIQRVKILGMVSFLAMVLVACPNLGDAELSPNGYTIEFAAVNNLMQKTPVTCGETLNLNGTNVKIADLRFFVSNIKGIWQDGTTVDIAIPADGAYQYTNALLLDFEQKRIAGQLTGCGGDDGTNFGLKGVRIPLGLKGLEFDIGLQPEQNNLNATIVQPSPMNKPGMYWTWTNGYKFTKIEVVTTDEAEKLSQLHIGSTGCTMYNPNNPSTGVPSCSNPFRAKVKLTAPDNMLNPATQKVYLSMDALFNNFNPSGAGTACMPGASANCQVALGNLGLNYQNGQVSGTQSAFALE